MKATGKGKLLWLATADRIGKLLPVAVLIAALLLAAVSAFAEEKPLPLEPARVTLCGITQVKAMTSWGGEYGRPWLLGLDAPVLVAGDEFGEEGRVDLLQIVVTSKIEDPDPEAAFRKLVDDYAGKRACITGELFHSHTIHHFTDVLIILRKIELEK